jgi:phosphatidate cytidylyltransferase
MVGAAHSACLPLFALVPVCNLMMLTCVLLFFSPDTPLMAMMTRQIQGVMYLPFFLAFLVLIRQGSQGGVWIVWIWLMVAASDTGAFFCGCRFGRRALSRRISPNKTVEGALGGLGLAVVVGLGFECLFIHGVSLGGSVVFALCTAVAGQVGDLFESALKRAGAIKDSGRLLPGHGGILDRLDGVIFAAPVGYLFKEFLL